MMFTLGVIAFAVCILASVAWHECGHMWAAQATGMKVRRYFVGFGPTIWSIRRPDKRAGGTIEYGVKAIPLGGFCDIAGMTVLDEMNTDVERDRAMYKQSAWKRIVVLLAGPFQNFILGFVIFLGIAVISGLPFSHQAVTLYPQTASGENCFTTASDQAGQPIGACTESPAVAAGLRNRDVVTAVNGTAIGDPADLQRIVAAATGPIVLSIDREGEKFDTTIAPTQVTRWVDDGTGVLTEQQVSALGVSLGDTKTDLVQYNPLTAIPGTVSFTAQLGKDTVGAIIDLPSKVPDLWAAVTGGERKIDSPSSVIGASRMGGEVADRGQWMSFFLLLGSLNLMLGVLNLLPLLPLDGGHIAVVLYEKVRNLVTRRVGPPVDYLKLMPATYAVLVVLGGFMLLTMTADIINPIKIF